MKLVISYNENFEEMPNSIEILNLRIPHTRVNISKCQDEFGILIQRLPKSESFDNPIIILPHKCDTKKEYYEWLEGFVKTITIDDLHFYINKSLMWNGIKDD